MADKTIAYSNRGGFWKTRYSFFSSCYAFVDRCLISFNKTFSTDPVWKHDDNPNRTSFYGSQGGSGIAVTFNTAPSQNKLYKAFSLESTNNISGINTFIVNNSSVASQTKNIQAGLLQERGGIMYGHIGRETIALGANTNIVGEILGVNIIGEGSSDVGVTPDDGFLFALEAQYTLNFIDGSQNNMVFGTDFPSKLFVYFPQALNLNPPLESNYLYYFHDNQSPQTYVSTASFASYNAMGGNLRPLDITGNVLSLKVNFLDEDSYLRYLDESDGFEVSVGNDAFNFVLYSMSAESVNGEDPKGQTADAVITLGSDPYELYALNVEYSPTDLDHSK